MPANDDELYQETIDVYTRLKNNPDFKYFLKEAHESFCDLRACKSFEEYKYKDGYNDAIERIISIPNSLIKTATKAL